MISDEISINMLTKPRTQIPFGIFAEDGGGKVFMAQWLTLKKAVNTYAVWIVFIQTLLAKTIRLRVIYGAAVLLACTTVKGTKWLEQV
ncbi:hypothetical protein [Advenella incenata]|uniref:hypothetical protein n=1 Tax=Advenella incenata TaxID=267800 RepID=UPI0013EE6306|nr:hypothetical protein [Advenella incenata]